MKFPTNTEADAERTMEVDIHIGIFFATYKAFWNGSPEHTLDEGRIWVLGRKPEYVLNAIHERLGL